jgi:hypothetical protein
MALVARGVWFRDGARAVPADERSLRFLRQVPDGSLFIAETKMARSPEQLAMWWALCDLVAEHEGLTSDAIDRDLKIALGHSIIEKGRGGAIRVIALSIAVENLHQEPWNNLFTAAINKIGEWLETSPEDVRRRYNEIVADKRWSERKQLREKNKRKQ